MNFQTTVEISDRIQAIRRQRPRLPLLLAALVILVILVGGVVISMWRTRQERAQARPGTDIYGTAARDSINAPLYSPFDLQIDPMERLLLINFAQDPDEIYIGFEPQVFDDLQHGRGMLVIGWRVDGRVDVYHQPGLTLDPKTYDIAGAGLAAMLVRPLEGARFEVTATGVDAYFAFEDVLGRPVEVTILERSRRTRKPFGLLAPMGSAATAPSALPLVWLHDFYFVRRADTEIVIRVAGKLRQPDTLPLPVDGMRMYFTRYSPDPLIATLNPAYDGPLAPLQRISATEARAGELLFDLVENHGQPEIAQMRRMFKEHEVSVTFMPPLPNGMKLADGIQVDGRFTIRADASVGVVTGVYHMARQGRQIRMRVAPDGGWQPNEKKWSVGLMYRLVADFTQWPKTYVWDAILELPIDLTGESQAVEGEHRQPVVLQSIWQRTE